MGYPAFERVHALPKDLAFLVPLPNPKHCIKRQIWPPLDNRLTPDILPAHAFDIAVKSHSLDKPSDLPVCVFMELVLFLSPPTHEPQLLLLVLFQQQLNEVFAMKVNAATVIVPIEVVLFVPLRVQIH
jgi:hypothetical protein